MTIDIKAFAAHSDNVSACVGKAASGASEKWNFKLMFRKQSIRSRLPQTVMGMEFCDRREIRAFFDAMDSSEGFGEKLCFLSFPELGGDFEAPGGGVGSASRKLGGEIFACIR